MPKTVKNQSHSTFIFCRFVKQQSRLLYTRLKNVHFNISISHLCIYNWILT